MKKEKLIKLSFVGDLEVTYKVNNEAKIKGNYDFLFENLKEELKNTDYLVGNLETPIAGKKLGYTNELYCFNTPEEFLKTLKKYNFNLLTTANNHCLDRGVKGLKKTLENIKKYGLESIGTYITKEESENIFIKNIEGLKIAFITATYGTNISYNKVKLKDNEQFIVDVLRDTRNDFNISNTDILKRNIKKFFYRLVSINMRNKLKQILKREQKETSHVVVDDLGKTEFKIDKKMLEKIEQKIKISKKEADVTILLLHIGGQHNKEPGTYTKEIINFFSKTGVDAIICNHAHNVQKLEIINDTFVVYSLGNFIAEYNKKDLNQENLPTYSLILYVYIDPNTKKIKDITYLPIKTEFLESTTIKPVQNDDDNLILLHNLLMPTGKEIKRKNNEIIISQEEIYHETNKNK